jgi:hypothetical protein
VRGGIRIADVGEVLQVLRESQRQGFRVLVCLFPFFSVHALQIDKLFRVFEICFGDGDGMD